MCLLVSLALPAVAGAQEIYIWEDENGIKHFSDRRPDGDYEVEVQRAIAEPDNPVEMRNVGTRTAPEWRVFNRLDGPIAVRVAFSTAHNVVSEPPLPALLELPAGGTHSVLVGPLDESAPWRYRLELAAIPGPLDPAVDRDYRYRVPIPEDVPIRIGQAFFGKFSHDRPHSRHAVDFAMPEGTPVRAARDGVVMDLERHFHRNGTDLERDGPRANYVRVLHDDGSMAVYAHLEYGGVAVRPGQRVHTGQVIGRSGNTGFSTGPHLHFAVQINAGMRLQSIPFVMLDHAGRRLPLSGAAAAGDVDPGSQTR